jgi:DnaJ family protein C protein 2
LQAAPADAAAAAAPKPKKVVADSGEWSEEQELALVQALKQYGKELTDRWEHIAAVVPGKSKAACFKRFKELKEVFKAKKAG